MFAQAAAGLDAWLDGMRQPGGYGGPVVHWWRDCLDFAGPGLDWRYEGIIIGYLNLWSATEDGRWLAKARRAGDDLVAGQLPSANYRNSQFEINPATAGTPHEAACSLALLRLAECLRRLGLPDWESYYRTAERNLQAFWIGRLWDPQARALRDDPCVASFVPNKAATAAEALFALARLTGRDEYADRYALPTLDAILRHQVQDGALDGAIHQNSFGPRKVFKFFPFYIARCIPGLVEGYRWSGDERLADSARRAAAFVARTRYDDGSFPQVIYPQGHVNRYPQWAAATGDILRALDVARSIGFEFDPGPTRTWLLAGRLPAGDIRTAHGFGSQISQRDPGPLPEFRDLLPVCGWVDKAFRYLAGRVEGEGYRVESAEQSSPSFETECLWRGRRCTYREHATGIELRRGPDLLYRWQKGAPWAELCAPELLWK